MKKIRIDEVFRSAFSYLIDEYQFSISKQKKEDWGYIFEGKNTTTGLRVVYEFREAYAKVMLYRLVDGEIVDNTIGALQSDEKINGFSLEHIIALLDHGKEQSIVYPSINGIDQQNDLLDYLSDLNCKLKKYAINILTGDFRLFDELDKKVKQEYKAHYDGVQSNCFMNIHSEC